MMQTVTTVPRDPHAERWQEWQAAYQKSSRDGARRAVLVVVVVFAALAVALGRQLFMGV